MGALEIHTWSDRKSLALLEVRDKLVIVASCRWQRLFQHNLTSKQLFVD